MGAPDRGWCASGWMVDLGKPCIVVSNMPTRQTFESISVTKTPIYRRNVVFLCISSTHFKQNAFSLLRKLWLECVYRILDEVIEDVVARLKL